MNKKGVRAVVGVILMVAVVAAIAAACYFFVQEQQKEKTSAMNINMWISNYTVTSNGAVQIEFSFLNNNSKVDADITINVEEIKIVDRVETTSRPKFMRTINITIDEGTTQKLIAEPTEMEKNKTYRMDISMKTEYREYPIQSFYIFAE